METFNQYPNFSIVMQGGCNATTWMQKKPYKDMEQNDNYTELSNLVLQKK